MEKQCKIPVAGEMGRLRKERGKMEVKGVMGRDGEVIREEKGVRKELTGFWGDLFGQVRPAGCAV
jgi:hypothetical protein